MSGLVRFDGDDTLSSAFVPAGSMYNVTVNNMMADAVFYHRCSCICVRVWYALVLLNTV